VAVEAFDEPSQSALIPNLVPRHQLTHAYSVSGIIWPLGTLVGPAIAGVLVAHVAIGTVYALDALSFVGVFLAVRAMQHRDVGAAELESTSVRMVAEGWHFARRMPLVWGTLMIDLYATFFGSARAMVPLVATDVLHVGAQGYGLLATAQPIGAGLASLMLTGRQMATRQGALLLGSVVTFGAAWALFGLSTVFAFSFALYALTGAADTVSYVVRTPIRQAVTSDDIRGRVAGFYLLLGAAGPQLGEMESGVVAALATVPIAIVTGGLVTMLLTVWATWHWPELREPEILTRRESPRRG